MRPRRCVALTVRHPTRSTVCAFPPQWQWIEAASCSPRGEAAFSRDARCLNQQRSTPRNALRRYRNAGICCTVVVRPVRCWHVEWLEHAVEEALSADTDLVAMDEETRLGALAIEEHSVETAVIE